MESLDDRTPLRFNGTPRDPEDPAGLPPAIAVLGASPDSSEEALLVLAQDGSAPQDTQVPGGGGSLGGISAAQTKAIVCQIVEEEVMKLVQAAETTALGIGIESDAVQEEDASAQVDAGIEKDPGVKESNYATLIHETEEEIKDLSIENKVLQRQVLALQKRRSTIGTKLFLEGAESQYQIWLKHWTEAKEELDHVRNDYDNKIDRTQEVVREKQNELHELHKEFSDCKWKVASEARHTHSGKMLSKKLLDELKRADLEADVEIDRLRIEANQLTSHLKKTRKSILQKDQLPGDLLAVDFDQLAIENESLHDKLAKKIKEHEELRKKTAHVVHVLSHSREKLQFLQSKTKTNPAG
eukprot:c24739_g1_i4 orf=78-1142(+)